MRDKGFEISDDVVKLLTALTADERNVVYLLSGLPVEGALEKIAEVLPKAGFIAEEGCFIKPRSIQGEHTDWINLVSDVDVQWKEPCIELLNYFAERTPGSFIENRGASIRWRYWPGNANDTELPWARRQAAEAQNHIWDSLGEKFGLRIIPATRSFLVLPSKASRSNAVDLILSSATDPYATLTSPRVAPPSIAAAGASISNQPPESAFDFILAVGNDEKLLGRLNDIAGSQTVSTSMRDSNAKWSLDRTKTVEELWAFLKE